MFVLILLCATLSAINGFIDRNVASTCDDFGRDAYFNPHDIVDSMWKIFYFWANTTELYSIIFSLPSKQRMSKIISVVETVRPDVEVEWHRAILLMEPRPGLMIVLLLAEGPGAFHAVIKVEQRTKVRPHSLPLIGLANVRMKLIGSYIGMICCDDFTAYALVRNQDIPVTEKACQNAASRLGINFPNGRSYLYVKKLFDEL